MSLLIAPFGLWISPAIGYRTIRSLQTSSSYHATRTSTSAAQRQPAISLTQLHMTSTGNEEILPLRWTDSDYATDSLSRASISLLVNSPCAMERIGAFFGEDSREGDVVLLSG